MLRELTQNYRLNLPAPTTPEDARLAEIGQKQLEEAEYSLSKLDTFAGELRSLNDGPDDHNKTDPGVVVVTCHKEPAAVGVEFTEGDMVFKPGSKEQSVDGVSRMYGHNSVNIYPDGNNPGPITWGVEHFYSAKPMPDGGTTYEFSGTFERFVVNEKPNGDLQLRQGWGPTFEFLLAPDTKD